MISKEAFVKSIIRLKTMDDNMSAVDHALQKLSPDFGGFYVPEAIDITINILENVFNDKEEWIAYFVYELDYLAKYEHGMVTDDNDNPIDLSTWEKVYDFLIKNMEE